MNENSWEFHGLLHADLLLYDFTSVIYLKREIKIRTHTLGGEQWAKGLLCR